MSFDMEFDATHVTLFERFRDGNVKQQFRLPMSEVPGLVDSLAAAFHHLHEHPDHGHGEDH